MDSVMGSCHVALVLVGLSVGGTILALSFLGGDEEAETATEGEAGEAADTLHQLRVVTGVNHHLCIIISFTWTTIMCVGEREL